MIIAAEQSKEPERKRYVLCDTYGGGCGIGFTVPASEVNVAGTQLCPVCQNKRNRIALLKSQLRIAQGFGHTDSECQLCTIQNQIDDLLTGGYDWREDYERRTGHASE